MFSSSDLIEHPCLQLVRTHCACAHRSKPIRGSLSAPPRTSDVCLQIGLSQKRCCWLATIDVNGDSFYQNPKEGVRGFPVVPKCPSCVEVNPPKNATRTSANYRFCCIKSMREMLRSVCKKAIKCTK